MGLQTVVGAEMVEGDKSFAAHFEMTVMDLLSRRRRRRPSRPSRFLAPNT
jgi:hypothetical protein